MTKHARILLGLALAVALAAPAAAQQSGGTKIGLLTCKTSASLGLIIGSHQKIRCSFAPDNGPAENYEGHIGRLGLDLGVKGGGVMTWAVFAPVNGYHHGALAGNYIGAPAAPRSASASAPKLWSAGRTNRSRCSRSRSKARSASISHSASPG